MVHSFLCQHFQSYARSTPYTLCIPYRQVLSNCRIPIMTRSGQRPTHQPILEWKSLGLGRKLSNNTIYFHSISISHGHPGTPSGHRPQTAAWFVIGLSICRNSDRNVDRRFKRAAMCGGAGPSNPLVTAQVGCNDNSSSLFCHIEIPRTYLRLSLEVLALGAGALRPPCYFFEGSQQSTEPNRRAFKYRIVVTLKPFCASLTPPPCTR